MEQITGVQELNRKLRNLDKAMARKIGRKAVNKGLTVLAKAIRAKAPRKLRGIIGKRHKKDRNTKLFVAKAGVGVALTKKKKGKYGWYLFLQAVGTKQRITKRGGRRGRLVSKNFVPEAYNESQAAVMGAMEASLRANIEAEARRG